MKKLKITGIVLIAAALLTGGGYLVLKNMNPRQRTRGQDGARIVAEALSFYNSSGQKINGRIYRQEGIAGKLPVAIFCHGFGSTMSSGDDYCKALASRGWAAYTFDFRGGSRNSTSDGSTLDMSVMTEIDDATLVVKKLCKEKFVDRKNVFLIGQSQGGEVAALTAADLRKDISGLVLIYPAFVIQDDNNRRYSKLKEIPDSTSYGFITVGKPYFKDTWKLDPFKKIGRFKGPVLHMHGTNDQLVPISYSKKAAATYSHVALEVFEGAGHGFSGADKERAVRLAADFMDKNLN